MSANPYQILGVPTTATEAQIKKAYRDLAKKLHPDLNPGNKSAESKFKELNSAYEQIGTPAARAKYDRGETEEQQQEAAQKQYSYYQAAQEGGRYSGAAGFDIEGEDLFANLFGQARRGRGKPAGDYPGEDLQYRFEVDFKDAALGAERELQLPEGDKFKVKIPAGIDSGTKLKIKGRGGPGMGRGPSGDLYLDISVAPLPGFVRAGKNIESELPISFQEALLGADIEVPTIDGSVTLKVRPGVSTGTRLGIHGKGAGSGAERGYHIVIIKVVMPAKPDAALQELVRSWGDRFRYDPRAKP